jgi:hypothetical protein
MDIMINLVNNKLICLEFVNNEIKKSEDIDSILCRLTQIFHMANMKDHALKLLTTCYYDYNGIIQNIINITIVNEDYLKLWFQFNFDESISSCILSYNHFEGLVAESQIILSFLIDEMNWVTSKLVMENISRSRMKHHNEDYGIIDDDRI